MMRPIIPDATGGCPGIPRMGIMFCRLAARPGRHRARRSRRIVPWRQPMKPTRRLLALALFTLLPIAFHHADGAGKPPAADGGKEGTPAAPPRPYPELPSETPEKFEPVTGSF